MGLDSAQILVSLKAFPKPSCYWVAYSGGLDSHVLLHAMASVSQKLDAPVKAIHINHGLQTQSDHWEKHCFCVCENLEVDFVSYRLHLQVPKGESLEAVARNARYTAMQSLIGDDAMLLTAQHRDDQAETLILQLLRGAGIEGLASMPRIKKWHKGWHARPLLDIPKSSLEEYANINQLNRVEDPSNSDESFDRNYLRHKVIPVLQARWPSANKTIARSAENLSLVLPIIEQQTDKDLNKVKIDKYRLDIDRLLELSHEHCLAVLREWFRDHLLSMPNKARLGEIISSVLHASGDSSAFVSWQSVKVRRYRNELWLIPNAMDVLELVEMPWIDSTSVELPGELGYLERFPAVTGIPDIYWQQARVSIRWRSVKQRCQPEGRSGSKSIKKLAQEYSIPPWQRGLIPLLYIDDKLAAVADYCVCRFAVEEGMNTFSRLEWKNKPAYFK